MVGRVAGSTVGFCIYSGIPILRTSKGKKIGWENRKVREIGIKLQCLTEKGKRLLVRVIGRFETLRVREIGILQFVQVDVI